MAKRKIKDYELVLVIQSEDVNSNGTMKKDRSLHIGRIDRKNGEPLALACGRRLNARWVYSFQPFSLMLIRTCRQCIDITNTKIDGYQWDQEKQVFTPASNTGVN